MCHFFLKASKHYSEENGDAAQVWNMSILSRSLILNVNTKSIIIIIIVITGHDKKPLSKCKRRGACSLPHNSIFSSSNDPPPKKNKHAGLPLMAFILMEQSKQHLTRMKMWHGFMSLLSLCNPFFFFSGALLLASFNKKASFEVHLRKISHHKLSYGQ